MKLINEAAQPMQLTKYILFRDTTGVYRSWMQLIDGGYAELK